ncbi:MAG: hypothetical protein NZO58_13425 [Gemmataceae bacterium]|nr:hypothetical protein [Gemmataceae bacterium]
MATYKELTKFLLDLGIEQVPHSQKTYLGHLLAVYHLMKEAGCSEEVARAGMFHSIYGTQVFQGFALPVERRGEIRQLIGDRAEKLAYLNCAMQRETFDALLDSHGDSYTIRDRITGENVTLNREDYDDLCRVHLYDWLEQVPRSRHGWGYRRQAYRQMAARLGPTAQAVYDRVFSQEPSA